MSIRQELLSRLICSKFIFLRGVELLNQRGLFSSGLSVLHFHDSLEMALRVIAEHIHCSIKESCTFNHLIDSIDGVGDKKLSYRSALIQLNKARINFKHFGLEPKEEDANKFCRDLESFFPYVTKLFLDVDFDSISLTNLIGHRRTENHLNDAERLIAEGNYKESICSSAIAFTIYHNRRRYSGRSILYWGDHLSRFEDPNIRTWASNIEEIIESLRSKFNLIMDGINLADYRKFQRYTPTVNYSDAGTFEVVYGSFGPSSALTIEPTKAVALFCYRFAVETILFLKQNETLKEIPASKPKKKYRVVEKCDVIVWPCEQPEIIRKTEVGEILNGRADCYDKPDFFSVLHDGDGAYVKKSAVEPLGLEHESDPS